jgi:hypothetical protein
MKRHLVIALLSFSFLIKAQDSSYCYNGGIVSEQELISETETTETFKQQNSLILMPVMNEKEVMMVMKEKNDSGINKLIKKFKLSKMFQNVGFSAIPEALLGVSFIGIANTATVSNSTNSAQQNIGVGLVALSAVCLTSGICFKMMKTKNYKKAIKTYNETYN